ncbi:MAG: alkaline phosphatase family protein [Hyphomicrobiaceae bacterium]|nr:MAG: alkaline phosphatase family protein [Hyphomicrobiaceae bacterium]
MASGTSGAAIERGLIACLAAAICGVFLVLGIPGGSSLDGPIAPKEPWKRLDASAVIERLAFASCADQKKPQPIWRRLIDTKPDLLLMLGDNVYADLRDESARELKEAYAALAVHPDFAKVRASIPILATWDDHDYGRNDAGGDFPFKAVARKLFDDFWSVESERRARPGVYDARIHGPPGRRVQVILLDTRSFRSPWSAKKADATYRGPYGPDPDPSLTMLGPEQWAWLERELKKPADIRFIVSSIQVVAENHGFERWGLFPAERQRLHDLLKTTAVRGVVLLSGDRHVGAIYRKSAALPFSLVEVTSSSINRPLPPHYSVEDGGAERLGDAYREENFGLASIDWTRRRLTIALYGLAGPDPVRHIKLEFADIGLD